MGKKYKKRNARKNRFSLSEKLIFDILKDAGRPSFMREIVKMAGVMPDRRREVRELVHDMTRRGELVKFQDERYIAAKGYQVVEGNISIHPDGFAFVIHGKGDDIFIPPGRTGDALNGDKVKAVITKIRRKGPEGVVKTVLERNTKRIAGIFRKSTSGQVVIPDDERLLFQLLIPEGLEGNARNNDAVIADITNIPDDGSMIQGKVAEVLGDPLEPSVQVRMVITRHGLQESFSPDAKKEAKELRDTITQDDLRGRKDLRKLDLVTIDGDDARDFDDAVHVRRQRSGYILTVAIADVSHYVTRGMAIDDDAFERGTSIYFPSSVLPMLPEQLSNNLCSLMPNLDRLAMVARITFDRSGKVVRASFCKAVIKSCRRFTYNEVNAFFNGKGFESENDKRLEPMLDSMKELAALLFQNRIKRGSIDFDIPEVSVLLDDTGRLSGMKRCERGISNRMIEEFMLAANETVADFLVFRKAPAIFRIHGKPDRSKLEDFIIAASGMGLHAELPDEVTPVWFQKILETVKDKPQERIVNTALLRTMQQAVYSEKDEGHFGLASPSYLHFTSPIRRYPDLIVHRILKGNLKKTRKRPVYSTEQIAELAGHLSGCERKAVEAEREMLDRLKVAFMSERIGEEFPAMISAIAPSGFFVELQDLLISGFVKIEDVRGYFRFDRSASMFTDRSSGRKIRLGDEIKVSVKHVSLERRRIDFELVE